MGTQYLAPSTTNNYFCDGWKIEVHGPFGFAVSEVRALGHSCKPLSLPTVIVDAGGAAASALQPIL